MFEGRLRSLGFPARSAFYPLARPDSSRLFNPRDGQLLGMNSVKAPFPATLVRLLCLAGLLACLASVPLACALGPLDIAARDVIRALLNLASGTPFPEGIAAVGPSGSEQILDSRTFYLVIAQLRLPRVILALLAGAGLSVAGVIFQAILRNPLADPFTLGVSGGAAFGAALAISLGLTGAAFGFGLPVAAFAGAGASLFAVLMLGRIGGGLRHETLILAGVVVSAFLAALIALVKALDEASVTGIVFWIMGSFQGRGTSELLLFLPGCLLGCGLAFLLARELDILSLGDDTARGLGLSAASARLALLLAASAITASCVAVSGIIGFVGLIVPHLCRMLIGAGHRLLLPVSALAGGLLLVWSDAAARSLLPGGIELPVGVITALLGGPFFCFILGKKDGRPEAAPVLPLEKSAPRLARPPAQTPTPRPAAGSHVVCDGLYFDYGKPSPQKREHPVLENISFSLDHGESVALLGPNGSGKSTLLHCLAGLCPPWRGAALVQSESVSALAEKRRARLLATLPQTPENVPALAAFSLVLMGRYAHTPFLGAYSPHDKAMAMTALEDVNAAHLAHRPANCLSGGELQRVLLARCLAQETDLLLLDEATSGLDPACRTGVLDALRRRNKEHGTTLFAAMHDLNLAPLYFRRLIFLKNGRIEADGPPEDVFTSAVLRNVYDCDIRVIPHPDTGQPQALPHAAL